MWSGSTAIGTLPSEVAQQGEGRAGLPSIAPYRMPEGGGLPTSGVAWRAYPEHAALLIHDMQRYFVRAFVAGHDALGTAMANIRALRMAFARLDVPVIYTAQPGGQAPRERGLLMDFWGEGLASGADEEIVEALRPDPRDTVVRKMRYSAFFDSALAETLRVAGRDQLVVCGIYAHIGCLTTCCDAFARDIRAFLVADAVADFSLAHHRLALDWAARQCARVVSTATLLTELDDRPAREE